MKMYILPYLVETKNELNFQKWLRAHQNYF